MQAANSESHPDSEADIRPLVLEIVGMRCNNCASTVEGALTRLDGVRNARVSYALEEARLETDAGRIEVAEILKAVKDSGYEARERRRERAAERIERDQQQEIETRSRKRRMSLGLVLSGFIMVLSMGTMAPAGLSIPDFPGRLWLICAAAAIVQVFVGGEFYIGAWKAARARTTNMDTLVALGSSVAFFYSAVVLALGLDRVAFPVYFESAAMIVTLVMVGKFLESRARRIAGDALRELIAYQPDTARVERNGVILVVDVDEVGVGERVLVQPGEKFPLDGKVIAGSAHADESMLTGESDSKKKSPGDAVFAGTIDLNGSVTFEVSARRDDTTFANLVSLVREAQASRAPIQSYADRIAAIFVPTIIVVAVLVGLYWSLRGGAIYFPEIHGVSSGLVFAAATLLISCPCAMGLATPLALIAGTGVGATRGLLFKNATALEHASGLTSIVFDKTGTLTMGRPTVAHVECIAGTEERLLQVAATAEHESEHPLGRAIVDHAEIQGIVIGNTTDFEAIAGRGVRATVDGRQVVVGNRLHVIDAIPESRGDIDATRERAAEFEDQGMSVIFIGLDDAFIGWIAIGDVAVPTSKTAIERLRGLDLTTWMLTGDDPRSARAVAQRLGIDEARVNAGVLPQDKASFISELRDTGERVAMVGDGINDAAALASADVGLAIGSGTDIAIETADIVLIQSDLHRVADAIELSRRTLVTIRQNLFWAFAYNVAAIPLAAGVFVPWAGAGYRLSPGVAAGAMALSSLFVVMNSVRLRRAAATALRSE